MVFPPVLGNEDNGIIALDEKAYEVLLAIRDGNERQSDILIFQKNSSVFAKAINADNIR